MPDPSVLFLDQSGGLGGAELCLLDYLCLRQGPSETVVFSDGPFLEALRKAGLTTKLLPFNPAVTKASGGLQQLMAVPRLLNVSHRVAQISRQHDAIYANTQKAAIVGAVAAWMSKRPLIWHLHDMLDSDHFSRANRMAVVAMTNRVCCQVIANSKSTAEAYRWAGGRHNLEVVYNGIDDAHSERALRADSSAIREAIGVAPAAPLIGMFGRLAPWKGQHVLVDALATDQLAGVTAIVVGEALYTDADRQYADELQQRSAEGSLAGRVRWLGQRDSVPELMRACDVIVHCSTQPEPFGRVIVEGMLAERPVVASAAGGAMEIVEDGVNGLLTPPGDSGSLAVAVNRLLSDPELTRRISKAGHDSALQRFRLKDRVHEIDSVIASVCRSGND